MADNESPEPVYQGTVTCSMGQYGLGIDLKWDRKKPLVRDVQRMSSMLRRLADDFDAEIARHHR